MGDNAHGHGMSFWDDKNILELHSGGDYTAL